MELNPEGIANAASEWAEIASDSEIQNVMDYFDSQPPGFVRDMLESPADYKFSVGAQIEEQISKSAVTAVMMAEAGVTPESVVQAQILWIQAQFDAVVRKRTLPQEIETRVEEERLKVTEVRKNLEIARAVTPAAVDAAVADAAAETAEARRRRLIAEKLERDSRANVAADDVNRLPGQMIVDGQRSGIEKKTTDLQEIGNRHAAVQRQNAETEVREAELEARLRKRKQTIDELVSRVGWTPRRIKDRLNRDSDRGY